MKRGDLGVFPKSPSSFSTLRQIDKNLSVCYHKAMILTLSAEAA